MVFISNSDTDRLEHLLYFMFNNSLMCPAHAFSSLIFQPIQFDLKRHESKSRIPTLSIQSQMRFSHVFLQIERISVDKENNVRYQQKSQQKQPAWMSMVKNTIKLQFELRLEIGIVIGSWVLLPKFTPFTLNRFEMTKQWNWKHFIKQSIVYKSKRNLQWANGLF